MPSNGQPMKKIVLFYPIQNVKVKLEGVQTKALKILAADPIFLKSFYVLKDFTPILQVFTCHGLMTVYATTLQVSYENFTLP